MFGMGMNEILIVLVIAVIVVGPKQLPQVARAMGKLVAQFKRATNDLRTAVTDEVTQHAQFGELQDMKNTLESEIRNIETVSASMVESLFYEEQKSVGGVARDFSAAIKDIPTRDFEYDDPEDSGDLDDANGGGGDSSQKAAIADTGGDTGDTGDTEGDEAAQPGQEAGGAKAGKGGHA